MLWATASQAAFDRSSTGRIRTWLRTPMRPFSRLKPWKLDLLRSLVMLGLPALGLDVVYVGMLADIDRCDRAADIDAVLDHGVVLLQRFDGELVADRNVGDRLDLDLLVLVHDPADHVLALLNTLDHDDAHGVALVVHHEVNHLVSCPVSNFRASCWAIHVADVKQVIYMTCCGQLPDFQADP